MKKLNRGWVRNAAIIFLAVMLLLTFFSNTIMNFSLPEVATSSPESGTIVEKIRDNTVAQANSTHSIEVDSAREILSVFVSDGDEVKRGDRLFELEEAEDDALSAAVKELNQARLDYQTSLLQLADSDFASENETIRQYRQALQTAVDERNALGTVNTTVTAAQSRADSAQQTVTTLETQLQGLETELGYIESWSSLSSYIKTEAIAYDTAKAKVDSIEAQMGMSYTEFTGQIAALEAELTTLQQELADLQAAGADSGQISAKQSTITGVETELNILYGKADTMLKLNGDLTTASAELDKARSAVTTAAATAKTKVTGEIETVSAQLKTANNNLIEANATLTSATNIKAADEAVEMAQNQLTSALIGLSETEKESATQSAIDRLNLEAQEENIADLEEKIQKLESGEEVDGTTITAKYDGIITGLNATAGSTTVPGEPLASIEVAEMGYTAEITVGVNDVSKIKVGATADVSSNNYNADITGKVAGIKNDPENPSTQKIVVVDLDGDVSVGEQLSVGIHISSAQYETIVPRSAVGTDSNGSYVFVLEEKSSPLGTRYIASKVQVQVLAEDETQVAVSGAIERWDSIIRTSSSTLADRDYVRLSEG